MVFGKKVAIFDREWGQNSAPRDGHKIPCKVSCSRAQCSAAVTLTISFILSSKYIDYQIVPKSTRIIFGQLAP